LAIIGKKSQNFGYFISLGGRNYIFRLISTLQILIFRFWCLAAAQKNSDRRKKNALLDWGGQRAALLDSGGSEGCSPPPPLFQGVYSSRWWIKGKLHYCDLLWICFTTSWSTNPQQLDTHPFTTSTCHWITC